MLQLQTKEFDICRVSKVLAKYKIKASISNQEITLDGKISDELLEQLWNDLTISNVQNFFGEVIPLTLNEQNLSKRDEIVSTSSKENGITMEKPLESEPATNIPQKYDLLYPKVKRGEVYYCDFGEYYGCEQGKMRPAIVVQNNTGNTYSPTTIVLPCTGKMKKRLPVHLRFRFAKENMLDYDESRVNGKTSIVLAEHIKTVDKVRLRKYIGTMTPEFMEKIQDLIDISLGLHRKSNYQN